APAAPALPPTPSLPGLPPLPGAEEVLRGDWPAQPSGKRVTLDDTDSIDDALQQIADAAGWNVVLNTGRVGERLLVLKLKDVPVEEALRAALSGTGLAATRRGGVVVVAPGIAPVTERPVLTGFDRPSGRKFTAELDEKAGREVLLELGKAAGFSIVLPRGKLGPVSAHFRDTPVEEALKAVLTQLDLQAVREGSVVTISPREGGLGRYQFHGELGPSIGRTVEQAMRQAERELRQAERDMKSRDRGAAERDREQVGSDVVVEAGQAARDVRAIGGSVTLKAGAEAREVVAVGGSVTLEAGASCRQVVAVAGDVRVGPGASVAQDAVSVGGRVQVDPSGDVGGQRTEVPFPRLGGLIGLARAHAEERSSPLWTMAGILARYAVYLALGLLLVALFPRRLEAVAAAMTANPFKSLLAGFLGLLAQPFLLVLLVVTVLGIPLVAVQALGVAVAGVMGFTALAWLVGRSLPPEVGRGLMAVQLAAGTAIVVALTSIPFLGWLVWITAAMVTFGAVLRTRFGQTPVLPTTAVPPPMPPPEPPAQPAA
ncbi:MAG TPA: STN domain-containing protein, partial [Anaeromyxobacteraceae bacterium]|nr:STN domain-containing protein [Anaeromyxobacteraceae bacterium]